MSSFEELLKRVPAGCPEYEFYRNTYELIEGTRLPKTKEMGLAWLLFIERAMITFKDGRAIGKDSVSGSVEEIGTVLACTHRNISADPIDWKVEFPEQLLNPDMKPLIATVRNAVETSPLVDHIED
jgi:hypothetical protein